ncbi:nucleoside/nucleotide kinase family protein [Streptomyces sp. N2-109]|uniref:Nucleoside/nucleotide kinase family protein n=1 Tax=Streptomyces gossypii TaxID=2883101 RepID=A0ABT2JTW3_9ACTN|nr:nucleoside/nucleotide kinase family protein [Streptomyces gossypii]MCT2591206.1 nucleoside/nucleotide kinase family protein [Streptomyces gossypii]
MDLAEILEAAWQVRRDTAHPRAVLGLAGAPGAGKSTLARTLVAELTERHGQGSVAYLPLDGFHLSDPQLTRLGLLDRKGAPATFDVRGYAALLTRVAGCREHDIYVPDYDRVVDAPIAARHVVRPRAELIVTEGNYLACDLPGWPEARRHIDALWYVDAPDAVREQRLTERQLTQGRDRQTARDWIRRNDMPNGEVVKASRGNGCVSRHLACPVSGGPAAPGPQEG